MPVVPEGERKSRRSHGWTWAIVLIPVLAVLSALLAPVLFGPLTLTLQGQTLIFGVVRYDLISRGIYLTEEHGGIPGLDHNGVVAVTGAPGLRVSSRELWLGG